MVLRYYNMVYHCWRVSSGVETYLFVAGGCPQVLSFIASGVFSTTTSLLEAELRVQPFHINAQVSPQLPQYLYTIVGGYPLYHNIFIISLLEVVVRYHSILALLLEAVL